MDVMTSLLWKLRRVAADIRQTDVAASAGISTTRYSAIERGEQEPTKLEVQLIERFLPPLPAVVMGRLATGATT
jgi:DNA-binding XRE family transcriptional regulator